MRFVSTKLFLSIYFITVNVVCSEKSPPYWRWTSANVRGGERSPSSSSIPTRNLSPKYYENKDEDYDSNEGLKGMGREFDLFNGNVLNNKNPQSSNDHHPPRGGSTEASESIPTEDLSSSYTPGRTGGRSRNRRRRSSSSAKFPSSSSTTTQSQQSNTFHNPFSSLRSWLTENQSSIPRIQVRVEPSTTLKLRKRFRPLFKTVVTLGADFNNQLGVWQFKSSWEDSIIGGRLMLAGRELQLSKTWLLSVGKFTSFRKFKRNLVSRLYIFIIDS